MIGITFLSREISNTNIGLLNRHFEKVSGFYSEYLTSHSRVKYKIHDKVLGKKLQAATIKLMQGRFRNRIDKTTAQMMVEISSTLRLIFPCIFFQIEIKLKVFLLRLISGERNG